MNKTLKIIILVLLILILLICGYIGFIKYQEYKEEERIRNAIIKIEFKKLEIEFNSEIKVSDLISSINGEYITNPIIDTSIVGKKEVSFKYLNEEGIKVPYSFYVDIIDNVPPVVSLGNSYTITKGSKNFKSKIFCADNYDDNPKCEIIGEYDVNTTGNYDLVFEAKDFSGNITKKNFVLKVVNQSSSTKKSSSKSSSIPFKSLYNEYKKDNTKIGIDVSRWQGKIDYEKVKSEGVEFVFIKLGGQLGIGKEYYLDPKFKENYEGFKNVGIPIGLYFYSYMNSPQSARNDALWVISQIKDYNIEFPIALDWESWSNYNDFHMSFNTLTNSANMFMKTIKEHGYDTMLYSSKNYLVNYWLRKDYPVWLAHYTNKTDYDGDYMCWQRTSQAKISGITENTVDFDICYIEE